MCPSTMVLGPQFITQHRMSPWDCILYCLPPGWRCPGEGLGWAPKLVLKVGFVHLLLPDVYCDLILSYTSALHLSFRRLKDVSGAETQARGLLRADLVRLSICINSQCTHPCLVHGSRICTFIFKVTTIISKTSTKHSCKCREKTKSISGVKKHFLAFS